MSPQWSDTLFTSPDAFTVGGPCVKIQDVSHKIQTLSSELKLDMSAAYNKFEYRCVPNATWDSNWLNEFWAERFPWPRCMHEFLPTYRDFRPDELNFNIVHRCGVQWSHKSISMDWNWSIYSEARNRKGMLNTKIYRIHWIIELRFVSYSILQNLLSQFQAPFSVRSKRLIP